MKSIEQLPIDGRRVFIRVDFNAPVKNGRLTDATRIRAPLKTIQYARSRGAKVILASHRGRPGGKFTPELSLAPIAEQLSEELGFAVAMLPDSIGPDVEKHIAAMKPGEVVLLENLRFHKGEEKNDETFSRALAALCDVYVNDAFGTAHRAHASTAGMARFVADKGAGYLLLQEVKALSSLLHDPPKPFVAIVGGAKVGDKIELMSNLLGRIDALIIGGAMAYTFLHASGVSVGASLVDDDHVDVARKLLADAKAQGVRIALPVDHVVARDFDENAPVSTTADETIPEGMMGLDIGPRSREIFRGIIAGAKTIFWNGPMGVFEWDSCSAGTMAVANAVADSDAHSVIGGGDSVAALAKSGRSHEVTHVSTGGGASLEFLEGDTLPGIAALADGACS
ncbi:MAG TPA: phosphoglycerate kinase [Candidatus Limnocylindrales bacterium]|nr:phosphoglycerate kinase [Candidatus Limnocylindrales bacterium]